MATKTIDDELLGLEKRYWQAIQDQDVDAALRLTDESCIVTGAQGIGMIDRQTLAAMMKATTYSLKRFEIKPGAQVRLLRDDVALVAYQVHEELVVEGKPVILDAAESSTWVRRDGRWLCAMHTNPSWSIPSGATGS